MYVEITELGNFCEYGNYSEQINSTTLYAGNKQVHPFRQLAVSYIVKEKAKRERG